MLERSTWSSLKKLKKFSPVSVWFLKFKCTYGDKGTDSETGMDTVPPYPYAIPQTSQSSVNL